MIIIIVRKNLDNYYKSKIESLGNKNRNQFLEYLYKDPRNIYRTRYENTINNIEKIFDPEDIFFSLYENLFTKDSFNRLRSFLGISGALAVTIILSKGACSDHPKPPSACLKKTFLTVIITLNNGFRYSYLLYSFK